MEEESNLHLRYLPSESVQTRCSFSMRQKPEPPFDGAYLILVILIKHGSRHFFQSDLALVNVCYPLLGNFIRG
jgi:hypothetical protein